MQARARRTREKILAQAKRAFSERGFEATNLTEHILTPAGVSVGSFYHQFTNKREVLLEIFEQAISARHERLGAVVGDLKADSFGEAFRVVLDLLLDDLESDPELWQIHSREHESPDPEIRQKAMLGVPVWTQVMIRVMEPYYPGDDPQKALIAEAIVYMGFGMIREYLHSDRETQLARRAELVDTGVRFSAAAADALLRRG